MPPARDDLSVQLIHLLVEDRLFSIPRNVLLPSVVFQDMFSLPQPPDVRPDGSDEDHPLRLETVSASEFRTFLRLVMAYEYPHSPPQLDISGWTTVLRLSSMWQMPRLRDESISHLRHLFSDNDAAEKLVLSETYDIPKWTFEALRSLVDRTKPMDIVDYQKLGIDRILKIAALREGRVNSNHFIRASGCHCSEGEEDHWGIFCAESKYRCPICDAHWQPAIPQESLTEEEIKAIFGL